MARSSQLALRFRDKNGQRRGRIAGDPRWANAGRKRVGNRAPHRVRPELAAYHPVHVVARAERSIGSLRKRHLFRAIRLATLAAARRELFDAGGNAFRIIHVSIQRTHVHLLIEADHQRALSNGMQGFLISAAKHINREFSRAARIAPRRRGPVFPDRFHQQIIRSPRHARHALNYVLNNWRKHREDRFAFARDWRVDPFSTGLLFPGWRELSATFLMWQWRDGYDPLIVYRPRSWLLRIGWSRAGTISLRHRPTSSSIDSSSIDRRAPNHSRARRP